MKENRKARGLYAPELFLTIDFCFRYDILINMTEEKTPSTSVEVEEKTEDIKKEAVSVKKESDQKESRFDLVVSEMTAAGLHFGHRTSRIHPKMKPYIAGVKNTIHIIDLESTKKSLDKALEFIAKLAKEEKKIIFVGTKVQMKDLLKKTAIECKASYINERWLGGTLTNFKIIKGRVDHFKELEEKKNNGELDKYTKKERLKIDKELRDLEAKFGGMRDLVGLPDALFVLDMRKDGLAIKEANMKNIPIIAIADTNVNPELVNYPIYANDDAISSISYILSKVKDAIIKK